MFPSDQDHLRVLKPITTDGLNLALDKDGKRRMKTVFMPLSAEPYLKRRNEKLPDNLKLVIEKVEGVKTFKVPDNAALEIETLKALLSQAEAEKEALIKKANTPEQEKEPVEVKEVVIEDTPTKSKKAKDEKDK